MIDETQPQPDPTSPTINPYSAPAETEANLAVDSTTTSPHAIDYPGGLFCVLGVGVCGMAIVTLTAIFDSDGAASLMVTIAGYILSHAVLGMMLTGDFYDRLTRFLSMGLLSIPMIILYIPACAVTTAYVMDTNKIRNGFFVAGSTYLISFLAAGFLLRLHARQRHQLTKR